MEKTKDDLSYEHGKELDDLRISDLFIKLKGADFIKYAEERKGELPAVEDLKIWQSFHNGKATLDFCNVKEGSKSYFRIGVQIEGDQFRIIVEKNKRNENGKINTGKELFDEFKDKGWFDKDFDKNKGEVFGHKTKMKSSKGEHFNKYEGDDYIFVYQYLHDME